MSCDSIYELKTGGKGFDPLLSGHKPGVFPLHQPPFLPAQPLFPYILIYIMESMNITGIEVGEEDMYRLMKEQALTFIADMFINLQEQEISMHDEIAKRIIPLTKVLKLSWTGPSDQLGTALWERALEVQLVISIATSFFCILQTKRYSYSNIEC